MLDFMMKRLHGNKKKGFTLVELIVVLVILAILLAILVPALLGYIDRARDKQVTVDARTAYLAAETAIAEDYAKSSSAFATGDFAGTPPVATLIFAGTGTGTAATETATTTYTTAKKAVATAAYELAGITNTTWTATATIDTDHVITTFVYTDSSRHKKATMTDGDWVVADAS